MNTWKPITKDELNIIVKEQLSSCAPDQKSIFIKYRVPLKQHGIKRYDKNEHVFVVAIKNNEALYYEDVEEGFNFSPIGNDGTIKEHWCNQNELNIALLHWQ